jgi:uncharacterized protein with gpF-like domain
VLAASAGMKGQPMAIFSKLVSALKGGSGSAATRDLASDLASGIIPTIEFDSSQMTEVIKADLASNIKMIKEFDGTEFNRIYSAALQSVTKGGDLGLLAKAIMDMNLPDMTKRRAGEISASLNNKAKALMTQQRQIKAGIKYAIWTSARVSCDPPSATDTRQTLAHLKASGKRYEVAKGMFISGRRTLPGRDEGCKCFSRPVLSGFD